MGSLQSSLLGFGVFKLLQQKFLTLHFTPLDNVILQTTAVATATMPLAGGNFVKSLIPGFVGILPALGMLNEKDGVISGFQVDVQLMYQESSWIGGPLFYGASQLFFLVYSLQYLFASKLYYYSSRN